MNLHAHVAQRIAQLRHDHPGNWSAAKLASEVSNLGVKMSRATLSKLEMAPDKTGARLPTLTEFLALCYALDTSPLAFLLPPREEPVLMFGSTQLSYDDALGWLTHTTAPDGIDVAWYESVAPDELKAVNEALRGDVAGLDDLRREVQDLRKEMRNFMVTNKEPLEAKGVAVIDLLEDDEQAGVER